MGSALSRTHGLGMEKNDTMANQKKEWFGGNGKDTRYFLQIIFSVPSFLGDGKDVDVKCGVHPV